VVTLLAAGAVIVVVVLVGVIVLSAVKSDERVKAGTAPEAAEAYLEALANGDADAALAFAYQTPPSRQFLTDEILRKQLEISPITEISVRGDFPRTAGSTPDVETVDMSANFGDEYSQGLATVRKSGGEWKLDNSVVKLSVPTLDEEDRAVKSLTIFGVPIAGLESVYVLPGALDVKSTSRFVDVQADPVLLSALGGRTAGYLIPTVSVNDAGRIASKEAVDTFLRNCINPGAPPDCPKWNYPPDIDPKSVRFKETEGLDDMATYFTSFNMTNALYGYGDVVVTEQTPSGPTGRRLPVHIGRSVDLLQDPPLYSRPDR
jgi:hypothetical protein